MSLDTVRSYLQERGLIDRVTVHRETSDTVEHAAAIIGCKPEEIAKTMGFVLEDHALLVVAAGDVKVSNSKFKARFGKKPTMILVTAWRNSPDTSRVASAPLASKRV